MQDPTTMPALTQTLGLDLGDRHSHWCLITAAGKILGEDQVSTTRPSLTRFFGWVVDEGGGLRP